ncbi:DMT family transporter [Faecalibaculum rodentium]|jgi:drug/metabolite transporter (DMT)-like permease|uniref:DMT family transporter n=1 Tax=Faecalibaculum rodentium TaxID=1702221 RepID=UPI001C3D4011|nr:DMT family transporter [Faecalibaculum rodentium]
MSDKQKGILCLVASSFCFALMNVFIRLAGDIPSIEKTFFRNFIAMIVAGIAMARAHEGFAYRRQDLPLLTLRSVCGTLGMMCNFYAVDHMLLADATAIQKLVPFFTILSSWLILKERIKSWQGGLILLAFAASLLVVKPGFTPDLGPAIIQFAGALAAGFAYTYVRQLTLRGVAKPKIIFFFSAFSCIAVIPFIAMDFVQPDAYQLLMLLCTGLAASGGQFAITYAYGFAPARQISIYDYSQILFSALFGLVFFGQLPDWLSWLGYVLLIAVALANFVLSSRPDKSDPTHPADDGRHPHPAADPGTTDPDSHRKERTA